jgi:hypothetical protein
MKTDKKAQELNKKLNPFGFHVNEKGELIVIGERDGKEYKIGGVRKRVVDSQELEKFLEKSNNQEKERTKT